MIGIDPNRLSLWEYTALVVGFNDANNPEQGSAPPPMSGDDFDALLAEVG